MNEIYQYENKKRNNKKMWPQTDLEFQKVEIKNLNKNLNIGMFSTSVYGGKVFIAEQKIRELKNILAQDSTKRNNDKSNK